MPSFTTHRSSVPEKEYLQERFVVVLFVADMEEMDPLEALQNVGFVRGLEPLLAGRGGPGEHAHIGQSVKVAARKPLGVL